MPDLTPDIAAVLETACETNAAEAASALARALDTEMNLVVRSATTLSRAALPNGCDGAGLVVLFKFGHVGAIGILPVVSGLLPEWCAAPDATGHSKLTTLAQELSMLLVPEDFMADDFQAAQVASLSAAIDLADISDGAGLIPLELTSGEKRGVLTLLWPCRQPDKVFDAVAAPEAADAETDSAVSPAAAQISAPSATAQAVAAPAADYGKLPAYTRSLLRIKVPVIVSLASKKQSIHQIVELAAGSIIKFDKSCEEMLDLEVGGLPIAQGEAVKVGEKFGLRINSMILPGERFRELGKRTG